jgi:sugar lactone lactonase YvrE
MAIKVEQLTGGDAYHGEGPVWDAAWGGLRWVDMLAGDVLHLDSAGQVERWHVGSVAAVLRPRRSGGLVIAIEDRFVLAEEANGPLTALPPVFDDPALRFNEGGCDPDGNLFVGTMAYAETPGAGSVYRLGVDHTVDVAMTSVTISNGLAWTADGTTAYYVDSPTSRIDRFDWDTTLGLHNRRPFVSIAPEDGAPDGLTVDAGGGVWVALYNGQAVRGYGSDGDLMEVVELPVPKVTACTFGGPALDQLFITTSRLGDQGESHPAAGALFVADVGARGLPVLAYGG